ncbi:uncharacterized protein LOC127262514 [Andrographis paniculata]|uniref:uncharacterized protein LOC127262514 n=1 Tax=Andrographis paniculata TaxID=175694 RepID=UPI0021E70E60|nr:uncharacterized protein LOC127262514 [Andrographis paniculata]
MGKVQELDPSYYPDQCESRVSFLVAGRPHLFQALRSWQILGILERKAERRKSLSVITKQKKMKIVKRSFERRREGDYHVLYHDLTYNLFMREKRSEGRTVRTGTLESNAEELPGTLFLHF